MQESVNGIIATRGFETPRMVREKSECWFYHTMDLPEAGTVTSSGAWDLRGKFAQYIGGVDLRGKSFLDVGTANGFSSFEAEKAGASLVTSFDAKGVEQLQRLPYPDRPDTSSEAARLDELKNGYWLAHRLLKSSSRAVYGDIYQLTDYVEPADVVFVGQLLIHLGDALAALRQVALVTSEYLIIAEGMFDHPEPIAIFCGGNGNYYSWWQYSPEFFRQYLNILGFRVESCAVNNFFCAQFGHDVAITTMVARRYRPLGA